MKARAASVLASAYVTATISYFGLASSSASTLQTINQAVASVIGGNGINSTWLTSTVADFTITTSIALRNLDINAWNVDPVASQQAVLSGIAQDVPGLLLPSTCDPSQGVDFLVPGQLPVSGLDGNAGSCAVDTSRLSITQPTKLASGPGLSVGVTITGFGSDSDAANAAASALSASLLDPLDYNLAGMLYNAGISADVAPDPGNPLATSATVATIITLPTTATIGASAVASQLTSACTALSVVESTGAVVSALQDALLYFGGLFVQPTLPQATSESKPTSKAAFPTAKEPATAAKTATRTACASGSTATQPTAAASAAQSFSASDAAAAAP